MAGFKVEVRGVGQAACAAMEDFSGDYLVEHCKVIVSKNFEDYRC